MLVIILAGGQGTRLAEETEVRPKPMVEVGGWPLLWHIMKGYAHHGFKEFAVALGYKGDYIKRYFVDYALINSNFTVQLGTGDVFRQDLCAENWKIHLIDTGLYTNTGGRVKRLAPWIGGRTFMMTYGDGVANVDVRELLRFHQRHGKLATVTAVRPPARFGELLLPDDPNDPGVVSFEEKPQTHAGWINGGFFVLEPQVLDYIDGDDDSFQANLMVALARDGQLAAYRHPGFWQCMDTMRDVHLLREMWNSGRAVWKVWE
jgi:glucose-1-phosphate cytidylyltransferase